jgi:hypothetical protein
MREGGSAAPSGDVCHRGYAAIIWHRAAERSIHLPAPAEGGMKPKQRDDFPSIARTIIAD